MPKKGEFKDFSKSKHGDLTGKTFDRLHVDEYAGVKYIGKIHMAQHMWKCTCECGTVCYRSTNSLVRGDSLKSCGCYTNEIRRANAMKAKNNPNSIDNRGLRRLYTIYNNIKERCLNVGGRDYAEYGARGIYVCDEWLGEDGFETFVKWAKANGYEDNLSIDRIDNDGPYAPWNCRWTTMYVQTSNTRINIKFWDGEEIVTMKRFISKYNLYNERFVFGRFEAGWNLDAIIHCAKHPELKMRKVPGVDGRYVNKNGFMVLVPRYFDLAPDDVKKEILKHEESRAKRLSETDRTKLYDKFKNQFFGEGYTL